MKSLYARLRGAGTFPGERLNVSFSGRSLDGLRLPMACFFVAVALIFSVTYTTYAFSKYRGVILPAVYVDKTSLSGMSSSQAYKLIDAKLAAIYGVPLRLQVPEP